MQVDPKYSFWLGVVTTIFLGGSYASMWAGWVPDATIPMLVGINKFLGFVGTTIMTALAGVSSHETGPISKLMK